jgi:hypothetical protein
MIQQTFPLAAEDCHTFVIHDAGGDGLLTPGFYMLYYNTNTTIYQGSTFEFSEIVDFNTADPVGIDEQEESTSVSVFPNPMNDKASIDILLAKPANVSFNVYALTGQIVASSDEGVLEAGRHAVAIDASSWNRGIYMYRVIAGEEIFTGKLTVR